MSALTLGLHAANSYFQEQDREQERERTRKRFENEQTRFANEQERMEWERQRAKAGLSVLPEQTEAARTGAQLTTVRNRAGLELAPGETANAKAEQELRAGELEAKKGRQTTELATAANKAELDYLMSNVAIEELPKEIARRRAAGAINDVDTGTIALGKLGDLIQMGDQGRVIKFMNDMAGALGGGQAPVAAVAVEQDPQTGKRMFIARDAQGAVVTQYSTDQMEAVRATLAKGKKPELMSVSPGATVLDKTTGKPVYTAPESEASKRTRMGPLERDVDYLVRAHGMSKDEALTRLQAAKTMSREQFILKGASDMQAMGKRPTPADLDELGALFDRATGKPTAPTTPAAAPGAPVAPAGPRKPLDPAIQKLLGL